jgi:hypothetical protein
MKPRRFRRRARTELVAQPEAALVEQPKRFGGVPHADMEPHDLLIRCFANASRPWRPGKLRSSNASVPACSTAMRPVR